MYELVYGSIFDKKCDIIIIPCNSMGGTTKMTKNNLYANEILNLPSVKIPGEVVFDESKGNFTNASIIGFAASVDSTGRSKKDYLHNICQSIKDYCVLHSLSLINIPLLGTGFGGLSIQDSFEILKFYFEEEKNINLRIFALTVDIYNQLNKNTKSRTSVIKNPRVFISYTGENPENRTWVKNLVCKLRKNGINARVDIYHLKLGYDLPQWMTNELLMADKVLLICDKCYAKKADLRNGGVGWETMIIQGDMMANPHTNKYICIIREENIDDGIPLYAKTKFSLTWTNPEISNEDFQELLYNLFDIDIEPILGDIPPYISNQL